MKPLISIILPVYNANKTIARCIESVLVQTYSSFELLIIDDGSSDGSGQVCREYALKDERIKLFEQENLGVSVARNVGLKNAHGEWITFCDSDDWVDDFWLEHFANNIGDSEMVIQGFNCEAWPLGKTKVGAPDYFGDKKDFILMLLDNTIMGYTWCKLFKRAIIEEYNIYFDEHIRVLEDEIFVMHYFSIISTVRNTFKGFYNYVYPDYHKKYIKKHNIDCALSLSKHTRTIYGYNNFTNPVIKKYFLMALGNLMLTYKTQKIGTKDLMHRFIEFYYNELKYIKSNRLLFKPIPFLIHRKYPALSHLLFSMYCKLLNLFNK